MNEAIDYSTVKWVKQELDTTLKQARQALEAYVETPADDAQLRFCAVHLHQVHGTLRMVELYGAALLAEEMEHVVEALVTDSVAQRQEAYELVMRGILQLPDYLERLITGHRDIPLVLLPLLNDLRAIRGQNLLSESSLFTPDLNAPLPEELQTTSTGEDVQSLARNQRHSYQLALLGWFRGKDTEANLDRLRQVLFNLRNASATEPLRRLWWAAEGVVVALQHSWLEAGMSTKLLLGQTDRQIKRLIDEGEAVLAADAPRDLLKNLLFYIAQARDGGEPVTQIKNVYRLGALLPDQSEMERAGVSLSGHNAELMATVSAAMKEDLARVKDVVDIFQRGGGKAVTALQPAIQTLRQVTDTLGMLGLGALRDIAQAQADAMAAMETDGCEADDHVLMDVATALISIESSMDMLARDGTLAPAATQEEGGPALPDGEFHQLRMAVADEGIRDITQAKDSILAFMENESDFDLLEQASRLFHQISGGLLLLGEQRAAAIIDTLRGYVADRIIGVGVPPDQSAFDALADTVSSIEYYLEGLREGRLFGQTILDAAERSLEQLDRGLLQPLALPTVAGEMEDAGDQPESGQQFNENPVLQDVPPIEDDGYDVNEAQAESLVAEGVEQVDADSTGEGIAVEMDAVELVDPFVESTSSQWGDSEPTPPPPAVDVSFERTEADAGAAPIPSTSAAEIPQALSEDIDAEILEIFIEESEEELTNIREFLSRWLSNEEDRDALTGMRRSFHTLKGSGRLVGAMRVGEFAWAFENMLNRVIDGAAPRCAGISALLEGAARALPELIAQIRDGSGTTAPVEALADLAQACSRGETVSPDALTALDTPLHIAEEAESIVSVVLDSDEATADEPLVTEVSGQVLAELPGDDSRIDSVLYEIFSNESRDHVGTVQSFLSGCGVASHECYVTDALLRALHTLHGSARMAGAGAIADVANAIERYVKALRREDRPLSAMGAELIGQAMGVIESLVVCLQHDDADPPEYATVIQKLDDLLLHVAAVDEAVSSPEALPTANVAEVIEDAFVVEDNGVEIEEFQPLETEGPDVAPRDDETKDTALEELVLEDVDDVDPFSHTTEDSFADPFAASSPLFEASSTTMAEVDSSPGVDPGADVPQSSGPGITTTPSTVTATGSVEPDGMGFADDGVQGVDYEREDQDLIDVFLEEGEEILAASDAALHKWVEAPGDPAPITELQRHLHTLKGGARMAGIAAVGDLSHALESLLIAVVDGLVSPSTDLFDTLLVAQDRLVHMLEAVHACQPLQAATAVIERLEALRRGEAPAPDTTHAHAVVAPVPETREPSEPGTVFAPPAIATVESAFDEQPAVARSQQELVRVRADLLDNMVNFAGEINIYRSRLEQQIGSMRFNLSELGQTVDRIRDQLRKLEMETEAQVLFRYERELASAEEDFDPLEMDRYSHLQQLSRSMLESISDLVSIQGLMDNITRESETLLLQQSRVNTELQEGLMHTRMVPFAGLAPRMRRIVRQAAQELGKRAELVLEGADGEMDRTVIDRIIAPIEHMLRNAMAHGIETPEQRIAAGKKPSGVIKVGLYRDGSEVVIRLADDGSGMNIAAIRRKACERGLIAADAAVSDSDVMQFVLETGFSTAEQVSQVAGRGVGMDVVNSEVKQLGGSLHIDSKQGAGTTFTIRLPFTLAISQALLVQVHEEIYAIPLTGIEGIVRMRGDELSGYLSDTSARFDYAGYSYPVHNLGEMLGHSVTVDTTTRRLPVLLVRSGDHRMALQVEGLLGSRETVVKSVGPQISSVRGISGATILGDGRVVLILDLGGLLRSGGVSATMERALADAVHPEARQPLAMVVDDSITVRKVTTRLLERNGMQVITAKDGVDAVAKLQEHLPDVMLLDIEMPRMDGFELATHVRNEERLRSIPIIMITSRTGDKHRRRAIEIGVDRYLGKPYQESDLLETINTLVKERSGNG